MAIIGLDCKLYRGTAGVTGSTVMNNVTDVTANVTNGSADITTRGASGWRVSKATLSEASLSFTMVYDPTDADFVAVRSAFFGKTPIALFVSDGVGTASTASSGIDADWEVTSFNWGQPLEEASTIEVECVPTNIGGTSGRNPSWKTGS